jgi:Flp pilus assembly protein TadD
MTRRKSDVSATALSAGGDMTPIIGQAARVQAFGGMAGQAGSAASLSRMLEAMAEMKAASLGGVIDQAVAALQKDDFENGGRLAIQALEMDERSGFAWYLLAIARERAGDFASSVRAYDKALQLIPAHAEVANDMGRLAYRMGMKETAEKLFAHYVSAHPENPEGVNNLACAVRDQGRYDEAVEVLRPALIANPQAAVLWNTLGTVLAEQGDPAGCVTFFDEALRLQPDFPKAQYNRSTARHALADTAGALEDCNAAMMAPMPADEVQMMRLARSTMHLTLGDIARGWDDYEARRDPNFGDVTHYLVDRPEWTPASDLGGKSMLIFGEQGLGDELLFANLLPDVIAALEPTGRLTLSVEPRLVSLFQRSFPTVRVGAHATFDVDGRTVRVAPFLDEDELAKIDLWAPVLRTPGICLVNLQYGDCESELAYAKSQGIDIWVPPGIDLKQDLDDVAALTCALDLTVGFSNASLNLAGACGAPVWLVTPQACWTQLGTDRYPWYPQARVFTPTSYADWDEVMAQMAGDLEAWAASGT